MIFNGAIRIQSPKKAKPFHRGPVISPAMVQSDV
jgi:hypothetical protein